MHEQVNQLLINLNASWRYRWYAVFLAWIIAAGGWTVVYHSGRYEASARVYVDTQSVLRPLLAGLTVQPNVDQMVAMMSRTLISRPTLDTVVGMTGMDTLLKASEDREDLITRLNKNIAIKSAGRENLYTIAYTDKDPQVAKRVVQALLAIFVEGSRDDQRKDSEGAKRFIDEQLKVYNEKLTAAENAVTEFRRRHMGLMAGDRRDYYTRLIEAQDALTKATLELKEAENSRDALKNQLVGNTELSSMLGDKGADEGVHSEIDPRILALEQKLDGMRLHYTELHPDIIAMVRMIDQLKEQKKLELKKAEPKLGKPSRNAAQAQDPVYRQFVVSLASAEANVAAIRARVAEYRRRYDELKSVANAMPQVDAEYTQLTRDYDVTRKQYESLLSRRESAEISGVMQEKASGVMDFKVIDPPQVPSVPNTPNRPRLMSLVLLAALGGGGGLAFLISQIRPTFNDERRLREVSGLQVLGTVIMAWTDAQKARRIRGVVAFLLSFLSLLSAYAVIMASLTMTVSRV